MNELSAYTSRVHAKTASKIRGTSSIIAPFNLQVESQCSIYYFMQQDSLIKPQGMYVYPSSCQSMKQESTLETVF